jgi:hypothetical protein
MAVSNIGPLPSIIRQGRNGVVFAPDDSQSLQGGGTRGMGITGVAGTAFRKYQGGF